MASFGRRERLDERRWREKYPHLQLPTYRQVDYWSRAGAFGDERRSPGSGSHRRWTDHELLKLAALRVVSDDLHRLDLPATIEIAQRLWVLLDQSSIATLRVGSVAITASLPETGETP